MLVKAWFANNIVKRTSKHERYNKEEAHTPSLNSSTKKKKKVKAHSKHSMDLPWHCDTLCTDNKHVHSLDCDMKENMRKRDNLRLASVLTM